MKEIAKDIVASSFTKIDPQRK